MPAVFIFDCISSLEASIFSIELVAGTLQNDLTQIAADKYDLEATEAILHVEEMELAFEATAITDTLATIETAAAKLDADLIAVNAASKQKNKYKNKKMADRRYTTSIRSNVFVAKR